MSTRPCLRSLVVLLAGCQTQVVNSLEQVGTPDCPSGGRALAFDGVQARVVAELGGSLPTGNTERTAEMWIFVKPTSWAINRHTIFEYGFDTLHQAFAIDMDVYPRMQVYSWDDDLFFPTGFPESGGWLHVAATYDGALFHAFVNGNEMGSHPLTGPLMTTQSQVRIAWSPFTDAHFDGTIDEVRLWNVARTGDDIKRTMSERLTGNEGWLVGYWRFDEGAGTVAHDSSTKGNDGALEFGPIWVPSGVTLRCP
jgi:Concanavalin A-like lectin/glucanases superfamily